MITNYNLIYETLDMRRLLLGAGGVGGAAAGLGLGGAIGYGLTRAVVGPKQQANNQQAQIK